MNRYTRTYTRPSTSIPWWYQTTLSVPISDFKARMLTSYYATGKCISEEMVMSVDELSVTYTGDWLSADAYNEYDADSVLGLYWAAKDEYCNLNGITKGPLSSEVI